MSELIDALERERVRLEDKLQRVRDLLALYEPATETRIVSVATAPTKTNGVARSVGNRASPKKLMMEHEITALLHEKVQLHRSAILNHLMAKGVMGGEKNPMAHLAAFLSDHRHLYGSDGRGNFRLRDQSIPDGEQEAGRPVAEPTESDGNVAQTDRASGF